MNGGYTPRTQSANIHGQPTETMDESMFQPGDTDIIRDSTHLHTLPGSMHHHDGSLHGAIREEDVYDDEDDLRGPHMATTDGHSRGIGSDYMPNDRTDSPGQQYLEEELYKKIMTMMAMRKLPSQSLACLKYLMVTLEATLIAKALLLYPLYLRTAEAT